MAVALAGACDVENVDDGLGDDQFRDAVIVVQPDVAKIDAPADAICSIKVVGQTTYDLESDYLPRTVWCENGDADIEALKAQAIAARSVVYYEALLDGSICDSQSCQASTCNGSAEETLSRVPDEVFQAVRETSGMYLSYEDTLTYAFYVAGSKKFRGETCIGEEDGAPTEHWVTYNNGKDGTAVEQTGLGSSFQPSDKEYGQNRGCMSQWGSRCLEGAGAEASDILQFYYGEDIEIRHAAGECVDSGAGIDDGGQCGDGVCTGTETVDSCAEDCHSCGTVAPSGRTVIQETDGCFSTTGEDRYVRVDHDAGIDGLAWTETTEFTAHTIGTWSFDFEEAGQYAIEVFVEPGYADETEARYRVTHNGEETDLHVNQAGTGGWIRLGIFDFQAGHHDQGLRLTDLSGTKGNRIVFDAVEVIPADEYQRKGDEVPTGVAGHRGQAQGCSVSPDPTRSATWLAFGVLVLGYRRRR